MRTKISSKGLEIDKNLSEGLAQTDMEKIKYIVIKDLLGTTGRFRLGFAWIVLEPMLAALIYVFLFSVINSNIAGEQIIIGIGTYGVFSSSFRSGLNALGDKNGGFTAERISTDVLIKSQMIFSALEGAIKAIAMLILLYGTMNIQFPSGLFFIPICSFFSIFSRSLGYNLALICTNSPDIRQIFDFIIRLLFFVSPVLYPLSIAEGFHREISEFNPLTYFIEYSRYVCGVVDTGLIPDSPWKIATLLFFIGFSVRGSIVLDKYRWRVSTWN